MLIRVGQIVSESMGEYQAAADPFERLLMISPDDPNALNSLMEGVGQVGDQSRLDRMLRSVVETVRHMEPQCEFCVTLAELSLEAERSDKARDFEGRRNVSIFMSTVACEKFSSCSR